MYCKKCGTEQKEGQQFCPKCGEPFIGENKKKKQTESFFKDYISNKKNIGVICKIVACLFALYLVMHIVSSFGGSKGGEGFLSRRTPIEDFLEKIDLPSTAYMVRIDKNVIRTDVGARQKEVPVGEGNSQDSFEWTIIFFPTDETKKIGKAKVEPWYIDRNAWADGMKISYDYEVRDDRIEFYNGVSFSMYHQSYKNCRDMRLTIENGDDDIQLRGEFADKERVFRLIQYRDWQNKNKHNHR